MTEGPGLSRERATDELGELFEFPGARQRTKPDNNLPLQLSSLIGRNKERAGAGKLLAQRRLLTLTGPGGSGKTRLALAVAGDVAYEFEDGVWWVALASLSDPELVPQAVASTLEVREQPGRPLTGTLVDHLASRNTLLILDNCEHLVEACERLVSVLLPACPSLRILATSRESLGVAGETVLLVPPLSLPAPGRPSAPRELERYEAVKLFFDRARSATPTFELTESNASDVALLCRDLDGIPLAIELAAARTKVLSVAQISSRLAENLQLLKGASRTADPRQQTLAATLEWSHELLDETERVLFRRLSVFAGGFTLEAAEMVCAGEDIEEEDVLDLLSHLIDKSLAVEVGDKANVAYCLEGLAGLIGQHGGSERAVQLYGASEALLEAVGAPLYVHAQDRVLYERAVEALRSHLGEEAFGAAWSQGRAMPLEQAVEYALAETPTPAEEASVPTDYPAGLSAREVDVLKLVARGLTNARIARELFISPNTVNRHLNSIYHKIGVSSRAAATRFASEHRLA